MYKGVKKIKKGKDSNRSIVRKLIVNFILRGKITTTLKRAKIIQSQIDRLVHYAIRNSESDKNQLLKKLNDKNSISKLINQAVPVLKARSSGFTRIKKMGYRLGDGANMVLLEWVEKVELERPKKVTDKKATGKDIKKLDNPIEPVEKVAEKKQEKNEREQTK